MPKCSMASRAGHSVWEWLYQRLTQTKTLCCAEHDHSGPAAECLVETGEVASAL